MENTTVKSRITRIFKKHFFIPTTAVKANRKLQDLGLNLMEQMEMMLYLESEFHIALDDNEVKSIQTVGDAVTCVRQHLAYAA
jgi:acyl carrier protein